MRHRTSTGTVGQVGTLLSGALGRFGWHLLGNDSIMTFQSTYTKALVPSVNYSAFDSLVDILSGMAFNHAKTPNGANKAARHERERQNHLIVKHQKEVIWTGGCQVVLSNTIQAGHRAVITAHK